MLHAARQGQVAPILEWLEAKPRRTPQPFIRIVNDENGAEVVRYDLTEDYSTETAMVFGEIYRHNGDWKFRAVGQGYSGGLGAMAAQYGLSAS